MPVVGRLDQYASMLATEFDETTANNPSITGLGTYYASEFSENVGIATTITANVFAPYDPVYDEFGGTLFGAGQGRYMRQNTDKSVIVYNEIDEVTDFYGRGNIVRDGLILDLDAGISASYVGSGTTWTDLSVYSNNGTLTNGPTYSSSNGGSIVFNGVQDYVLISSNSFTPNGGATIDIWFNPNANTADDDGLLNHSDFQYFNLILPYVITQVRLEYKSTLANNTQLFSTTNSIAAGNWYNVVGVVDSVGAKIYINGTLNASNTTPQNLGIVTSNVYVGAYNAAQFRYSGKIPVVRRYNRPLSAAEITQNYNALRRRFGL
jgi:Concanavalin A-like lectin/glucanases superfamily